MTIRTAGEPFDDSTPPDSRPPQDDPIQSMEEIGRRQVRARVAADGTRWCRCCDTTASPTATSAYCPHHLAERNPFLKRLRAQARREAAEAARAAAAAAAPAAPVIPDGMVLVPREALLLIANRAAQLSIHVARASRHYHDLREREGVDPVWLDNLMWSAKDLDAAITSGILNGDVLPAHTVRPRQQGPVGQRPQGPGQPATRTVSVPGRTVQMGRSHGSDPRPTARTAAPPGRGLGPQ